MTSLDVRYESNVGPCAVRGSLISPFWTYVQVIKSTEEFQFAIFKDFHLHNFETAVLFSVTIIFNTDSEYVYVYLFSYVLF